MGDLYAAERFEGKYFAGEGDVQYLELLDIARRMFAADPEFQNVVMLYTPAWNGFVEGPTWGAWWIQNSYGPTYCALPFYVEPYITFLQNAQDLWFDQMGDGKRAGAHDWVAPDGCLCDAASPDWIVYKQGDGRIDIHDWGMEFTAAGLLMQSELLLIGRDPEALERYLPKLERCANFIETRRDPENNLFLAGPAGNLLAPSYAGWKKPDGTYDKAYLAGLSVTYIAALDRLIELEKLARNAERAARYAERRDLARKGLAALTTDEGYFIRYLDPDGTRHGVFGAEKHGYFETSPNHDAVAFRVVDDAQAERIYAQIAALPGLRPNTFILPNYPGYDDMYVEPTSWLWSYGTWVNGGHWSTCEARAIMAYYRLGKHEDARKSMKQLLTFARDFRMDNPLVEFGAKVYQPKQPINLCYDSLGPPAALIRGLFEYLYDAEGVRLIPHIPPGVMRIEQKFGVRFGAKRLYLSAVGTGAVTGVQINGEPWDSFDATSVFLPYAETPPVARICVLLGGAQPGAVRDVPDAAGITSAPAKDDAFWDISAFRSEVTNTLPLRIGADSDGKNQFLGDIRSARVFNKALDSSEIEQLAQGTSSGPSAGVVVDLAFAEAHEGVVPNRANASLPARFVGAVAMVDTPQGKAARFAGGGWLETPHDATLDLHDAYTLEAWICPKALPKGGARIIDKLTAGAADGYLLYTCPGNSLRLITERGAVTHAAALPPDTWAHVAATFDVQGELRLYVNGAMVASCVAEPAAAQPSVDFARIGVFYNRLVDAGLGQCYEAQHARLVVDSIAAIQDRHGLLRQGKLKRLPAPSQAAADRCYVDTATKLTEGLAKTVGSYENSEDPGKRTILRIWQECAEAQ